ncbi:testis expressed protein 56 [Dasypus novemcinctus]|uniref:testis expressed protein 56 n=1 Tax=Dasypus novemcinctus TaxID=9361 RepID=UPI00265F1332|nr:testis expressed protein 56 [Dasypus novemcinctus]
MGRANHNRPVTRVLSTEKGQEFKNYDQPEVLRHTFETLSNLHRLLPNNMMEMLHSYRSEEDKKQCNDFELSGLERILVRHEWPKEINLTPKPSHMPFWKRKVNNNVSDKWKKCHLGKRTTQEPPLSTIVVRWQKKNMQPTEDLQSVIQKLSGFGPVRSVTPSGQQSAIVVFKDTNSACHAMNAFQNKSPGRLFQCFWQQPFMSTPKKVYSTKHTEKSQPKENKQETGGKKKRATIAKGPQTGGTRD